MTPSETRHLTKDVILNLMLFFLNLIDPVFQKDSRSSDQLMS